MYLLKKQNKKGFTLIELIVVIAILAILALLAVPAYNGVKDKAARSVAAANVRTVYQAAKIAQVQNDSGYIPTDSDVIKVLTGEDLKHEGSYKYKPLPLLNGSMDITYNKTTKALIVAWSTNHGEKLNGNDYTASYFENVSDVPDTITDGSVEGFTKSNSNTFVINLKTTPKLDSNQYTNGSYLFSQARIIK